MVLVLRNLQKMEFGTGPNGLFSFMMFVNMAVMSLQLFAVGIIGSSDAVFHYRMHAENCLMDDDVDGALLSGRQSLETDSCLTMIRIYALARKNQMGDELFTYPIVCSSKAMIPMPGGSRMMIYPTDTLYKFLGAKPCQGMSTPTYLNVLLRGGQATSAVKDYLLCGYLIDKNIDAFANALPRFYPINDKLPRHYREALTLYTHLRSNPSVVYHNDVMDTDYEDLQALEKMYKSPEIRKGKVFDQYAGTYWWYYGYE